MPEKITNEVFVSKSKKILNKLLDGIIITKLALYGQHLVPFSMAFITILTKLDSNNKKSLQRLLVNILAKLSDLRTHMLYKPEVKEKDAIALPIRSRISKTFLKDFKAGSFISIKQQKALLVLMSLVLKLDDEKTLSLILQKEYQFVVTYLTELL